MSEVLLIEPVVQVCAIITQFDEARVWAINRMERDWGTLVRQSPAIPFEAGRFYAEAMGRDLTKVIVEVDRFADPAQLADWKHQTNAWESEYARISDHDVRRPLNLDPGYLSQAKLVLATTKDRDHRIYLRDGMFAEVTLNYVAKRWIHHRWSYPSYRTEAVADFAIHCRVRLRKHLLETGQIRRRDQVCDPEST